MTCRSCLHSIGRGSVLWCTRWQTIPQRACADYSREPGSDDE